MRKYFRFVLVGSFFATVEEFLTIVVLRHDVAAYVFTLVILFPVYLTLVFFLSKLLDKLWHTNAPRELAHYLAFGGVGLLFEWFVMGLSPWSNPKANPLLMLGFQSGMFSFWSTVSFAPRLFVVTNDDARKTGRSILWFFVPYFLVVYPICLSVPAKLKFATVILLVITGYLVVNLYFVRYFIREFASSRNDRLSTI